MKDTLLSILFTAVLATSHAAEPRTAFVPGEIWPDNNGVHINAHGGGILFHEGTYYWFGEHKIEGGAGNVAHVGVHVYSSTDLYNWKDEGIALPVSDDPKSEIVKGCIIERPKVIFNKKTGKFVMWFHLELLGQGYSAARSGVAVADKVTGPYHYLGSLRPNAGVWPSNVPDELKKPLSAAEAEAISKIHLPGGPVPDYPKESLFRLHHEGGQMARDMNLFVDDDGKAYHIYSSEHNGTLHISQLTDDYLKPAGKYIRIFPGDFNEAPAMFKHRGKYYIISSGCTGWAHNPARLSVADSIGGPWKSLGHPAVGTDEQKATTFQSQSTFVLPVQGKKDAFIFMADRWRPENAIDGRYVWLPIEFDSTGKPFIQWTDKWDLSVFDAKP
jgi:beta-xylosidase